jgi:hypothetical protein
VLSILATTVLTVAGTFTVYTYLGVFMQVTGLGPRGLGSGATGLWRGECRRHPHRRQRGRSLGRTTHGYLCVVLSCWLTSP